MLMTVMVIAHSSSLSTFGMVTFAATVVKGERIGW